MAASRGDGERSGPVRGRGSAAGAGGGPAGTNDAADGEGIPADSSGTERRSTGERGPAGDRDTERGAERDPANDGGSERDRAGAGNRDRRGRRPRRGPVAAAVGVFGELLITGGLILGLFVVYSLWWTNVLANKEAQRQGDKVREHWAADKDTGPGSLDTEGGIGFLHVPAMSKGEILVKKGTSNKVLNDGVAGYYTDPVKSALPQDAKGNFSLAAHRDGHGAKFHNIDKIDKGDTIVFESRDVWYVYKVYAMLPETSKFNVRVLDKVPRESGRKKPGRYITLTTCTPVLTSQYRYVVWGELVRTEKVDAQRTEPKELR